MSPYDTYTHGDGRREEMFGFDAIGNLTSKTIELDDIVDHTVTYGYADVGLSHNSNQLSWEEASNAAYRTFYDYDAFGNRIQTVLDDDDDLMPDPDDAVLESVSYHDENRILTLTQGSDASSRHPLHPATPGPREPRHDDDLHPCRDPQITGNP